MTERSVDVSRRKKTALAGGLVRRVGCWLPVDYLVFCDAVKPLNTHAMALQATQ